MLHYSRFLDLRTSQDLINSPLARSRRSCDGDQLLLFGGLREKLTILLKRKGPREEENGEAGGAILCRDGRGGQEVVWEVEAIISGSSGT